MKRKSARILRLSGCPVALLMNFNTVLLKGGLRCCIP
jgi:hypothetical protein